MAAAADELPFALRNSPADNPANHARVFGFDALRAFAAILVVALHAAVPYLRDRVPGLVWLTYNFSSSAWVDGVFWFIKGFVMPLFLFLAGYFSAGLLARKSTREFLKHRTRTLLLPLAFACAFILPLDLYVWLFGLVSEGRVPTATILHPKFHSNIPQEAALREQFWGLSHLWFLQYLFLYCVAMAGFVAVVGQLKSMTARFSNRLPEGLRNLNATVLCALALSVLLAMSSAILWIDPEVVIGFQHGFLPFLWKFTYLGCFFAGGAVLYSSRSALVPKIRDWHGLLLIVAAGLSMIVLTLIHRHLAAELVGSARIWMAVFISSFAWLMTFGLTGFFLARCSREYRVVRNVADAAFWVYLIHHPIVALLQVLLAPAAISPATKFVLVTCLGVAASLMLYELVVKETWIGRLLNGGRKPTVRNARVVAESAVPSDSEPCDKFRKYA